MSALERVYDPVDMQAIAPAAEAELERRVAVWHHDARDAFSPETWRAWRHDWAQWYRFCRAMGYESFPADGARVAEFLDWVGTEWILKRGFKRPSRRKTARGGEGTTRKKKADNPAAEPTLRSVATLRRYVATLNRMHKAADLPPPGTNEVVALAIKRHARRRRKAGFTNAQDQAQGLRWHDVHRILELMAEDRNQLRAARDSALLLVACDTGFRRAELCRARLEEVAFNDDGSHWEIHRRESKTDTMAEGRWFFLSDMAKDAIDRWCRLAGIKRGPIFRGLGPRGAWVRPVPDDAERAINPGTIATIFKEAAARVDLKTDQISGHSVRVGVTQDLVAANVALGAIAQDMDWKSERMPLQYSRKLTRGEGALSRQARRQGRTN